MVYVIQICWQFSSSQAISKPVWHIPLLCAQGKTPDDGQRNCPKHVEFYSKNKFEKLVYLLGFIIRIYHDARAPERQKNTNTNIHTNTNTPAHKRAHTHTHTHTRVYKHTHAHKSTCTNKHRHIYVYIHTFTRTAEIHASLFLKNII